jgi:hypothetical protein
VSMGLLVPFAILYFASKIIFDPKVRPGRAWVEGFWKAASSKADS